MVETEESIICIAYCIFCFSMSALSLQPIEENLALEDNIKIFLDDNDHFDKYVSFP